MHIVTFIPAAGRRWLWRWWLGDQGRERSAWAARNGSEEVVMRGAKVNELKNRA